MLADDRAAQYRPDSTSSPVNFVRLLYELRYASSDLQKQFELSKKADQQEETTRYQIQRSHWHQNHERLAQSFVFLKSIEGAGWSERDPAQQGRPVQKIQGKGSNVSRLSLIFLGGL